MATARKRGNSWRVLCFDGYDAAGKRKYISITAPTKKEAELKAAQYISDATRAKTEEITVSQAIERYIAAKTGVLSPSTIRGYRRLQNLYYEKISQIKINRLTSEDMQRFISDLTLTVSAKSVANIYGLLSAAVTMFRPDAAFRVTLPKRVRSRQTSPSDTDVQCLFDAASGDLKTAIALAAFSIRRGEICALKYGDISGSSIFIHADLVEDEHNQFVYKPMPKTSESVRRVDIPPEVVALIGTGPADEYIIKSTPHAISHAFTRLRNKKQINIRFHDLRHYFASIGAVLGVPDAYLSDFGGWRRGSGVMKSVYQNVIENQSDAYRQQMTDHIWKAMNG